MFRCSPSPARRCAVVAALLVAAAPAAPAEPASPAPQASSGSAPVLVAPTRKHRLVYACRDGRIPMFSDRPCGEASLLRSLEVYTPAQPGRAPSTSADPVTAATKPAPREDAARQAEATAEKCRRLQQSLDEVDDRMRAGYPARQAGQLWQRWRDARSALREAGC